MLDEAERRRSTGLSASPAYILGKQLRPIRTSGDLCLV